MNNEAARQEGRSRWQPMNTILEIKAVERIMLVHEAQLLTYMKLSGIRTGLLLNFHVAVLKDGIRRLALRES